MTNTNITLEADRWKVSASEKRSLGDYENTEPFASVEGRLPAPESELDADTRAALRRELLAVQRDLQAVVERAADNRVKDLPEHEDWSDPLGGDDANDER